MKFTPEEAASNGCPTPTKMVFDSKAKANKYRTTRQLPHGLKVRVYPYRCRCGFWHLSKLKPRPNKEIHGEVQGPDCVEQPGDRAAS